MHDEVDEIECIQNIFINREIHRIYRPPFFSFDDEIYNQIMTFRTL